MRHEEVVKTLIEIINLAEIAKAYKTKIKKELLKSGERNPREIKKEATRKTIEFLQKLKKYGIKVEEIEFQIEVHSKDL